MLRSLKRQEELNEEGSHNCFLVTPQGRRYCLYKKRELLQPFSPQSCSGQGFGLLGIPQKREGSSCWCPLRTVAHTTVPGWGPRQSMSRALCLPGFSPNPQPSQRIQMTRVPQMLARQKHGRWHPTPNNALQLERRVAETFGRGPSTCPSIPRPSWHCPTVSWFPKSISGGIWELMLTFQNEAK